MSKAAVAARKEAKRHELRLRRAEAFCAMAAYTYDVDQAVVTCDECSLLQVTWPTFIKTDAGCFGCGHPVGTSA